MKRCAACGDLDSAPIPTGGGPPQFAPAARRTQPCSRPPAPGRRAAQHDRHRRARDHLHLDLGPDGRWTYVSPQVEEILGFTPAEWVSDPGLWARRLHPDDRERVLAEEEDIHSYTPGQVYESEYRLLTRSGESRWVRDAAAIVATRRRRPGLEWGPQRRTERRADRGGPTPQSEERLRAVIGLRATRSSACGTDRRIVEWNRRARGDVRLDARGGDRAAARRDGVPRRPTRRMAACSHGSSGPAGARYVDRTLEVDAVRRTASSSPSVERAGCPGHGTQRVNAFVRDTSDQKAPRGGHPSGVPHPLTDSPTARSPPTASRRRSTGVRSARDSHGPLLDLDDFRPSTTASGTLPATSCSSASRRAPVVRASRRHRYAPAGDEFASCSTTSTTSRHRHGRGTGRLAAGGAVRDRRIEIAARAASGSSSAGPGRRPETCCATRTSRCTRRGGREGRLSGVGAARAPTPSSSGWS